MVKEYSIEEIKQKLVSILKESKSGMSGVEISEKLGISRITMTKYLSILAAEGLVKSKKFGNVTLWHIDEQTEQFQFPDDYYKVQLKFQNCLIDRQEKQAYGLIKNIIHSQAEANKIVTEVIYPSVLSMQKLYDEAKIGNSELNFLRTVILNSIKILELTFLESDTEKNVIVISADEMSMLFAECAVTSYRSHHWNVYDLGNMSESINIIFDLDLQKFIGKIWKKKSGIMLIVIFSQTEEGLNFFSDAVNSIKDKISKNLFLILCGPTDKKTKLKADFISTHIEKILQWSETIFESHKN